MWPASAKVQQSLSGAQVIEGINVCHATNIIHIQFKSGMCTNDGDGTLPSLQVQQCWAASGRKPDRVPALALVDGYNYRVDAQCCRHYTQRVALNQGQITRENQPASNLL